MRDWMRRVRVTVNLLTIPILVLGGALLWVQHDDDCCCPGEGAGPTAATITVPVAVPTWHEGYFITVTRADTVDGCREGEVLWWSGVRTRSCQLLDRVCAEGKWD